MADTVHTYLRKRGGEDDETVELYYAAYGRALQQDLASLAVAQLAAPDLVRGRLVLRSLTEAKQAIALGLHGLYTREVVADDPAFFAEHPELIGPPKIRLRGTRGST